MEHASLRFQFQLLDIPKLPNELFNLICKPEQREDVEHPVQTYDKITVMQLCECATVNQFDWVIIWSLDATENGSKSHWGTIGASGRVEPEEQDV